MPCWVNWLCILVIRISTQSRFNTIYVEGAQNTFWKILMVKAHLNAPTHELKFIILMHTCPHLHREATALQQVFLFTQMALHRSWSCRDVATDRSVDIMIWFEYLWELLVSLVCIRTWSVQLTLHSKPVDADCDQLCAWAVMLFLLGHIPCCDPERNRTPAQTSNNLKTAVEDISAQSCMLSASDPSAHTLNIFVPQNCVILL